MIEAVLMDLDGTLYFSGEWLEGVHETLDWLLHSGCQVRIVTNTTLRSCRQILQQFLDAGNPVPGDWIFTPAKAAAHFFRRHPPSSGVLALVHPNIYEDLGDVPLTRTRPADTVLIGDMGDHWRLDALDEALRALMDGARLAALQRNPYWISPDGPRLDAGAFTAALEYAGGTRCELVFGKPNPMFFHMVLESLALKPHQVVMVGDDLETDVFGAQAVGIPGILVLTGKSATADWQGREYHARAILEDLRGLPRWLLRHLRTGAAS